MNNQQIFDKVAKHLLKQNAKAINADGTCLYRSPKNRKCAVGCLIKRAAYSPDIEYKVVYSEPVKIALRKSGIGPITTCKLNLLNRLQKIHDEWNVKYWEAELHDVADEFELKWPKGL